MQRDGVVAVRHGAAARPEVFTGAPVGGQRGDQIALRAARVGPHDTLPGPVETALCAGERRTGTPGQHPHEAEHGARQHQHRGQPGGGGHHRHQCRHDERPAEDGEEDLVVALGRQPPPHRAPALPGQRPARHQHRDEIVTGLPGEVVRPGGVGSGGGARSTAARPGRLGRLGPGRLGPGGRQRGRCAGGRALLRRRVAAHERHGRTTQADGGPAGQRVRDDRQGYRQGDVYRGPRVQEQVERGDGDEEHDGGGDLHVSSARSGASGRGIRRGGSRGAGPARGRPSRGRAGRSAPWPASARVPRRASPTAVPGRAVPRTSVG